MCVCTCVCVYVCARLQYGKVHLKGRSLEPRCEVNWEFSVCRVINLLHLRGFRFRVNVDAAQVRKQQMHILCVLENRLSYVFAVCLITMLTNTDSINEFIFTRLESGFVIMV